MGASKTMTVRKSKAKVSKEKTASRRVKTRVSRLSSEITTIGFQVSKLSSAQKLKGNMESWKQKLGGKGAGLVSMARLKIPVPPAFNLSTELCQVYLMSQNLPKALLEDCRLAMEGMNKTLEKKFGSSDNPLLVSVRSGAPVSMPGMMDTILNLGLNTEITKSLAERNPTQARFWWDCYRRLITMFADVVLNLNRDDFDDVLERFKRLEGVHTDSELSAEVLEALCGEYLEFVKKEGVVFPQEPYEQLAKAIEAVFRSWNTERAVHYRQINAIPDDWGTSVTVQAMVFGNYNNDSGTGVVFTRNPSDGSKKLYGEYLMNAQGEDVVAGIRTPHPIEDLNKQMGPVFKKLQQTLGVLENHFNDVQDVEFTIENRNLFVLQTRTAKRTATAHIENNIQFVKEKKITRDEALVRMNYSQVDQLLHPSLKPTAQAALGKGLPASPGAVSGRAAFDAASAIQMARAGERVVLVRRETSPEDIMGMSASEGILTATGGMTSHAAVVGRGMGKACVVGCTDLKINEKEKSAELGGQKFQEGSLLTLNGSTGEIYLGELPTEAVSWTKAADQFFGWADDVAELQVFANADTAEQVKMARSLGAKGVGLCRTEHMFFETDRLRDFRKMVLSKNKEQRDEVVTKLKEHQKSDFIGILSAMNSLSVCVRLLDPPLHEFLPSREDDVEIQKLAGELKCASAEVKERILKLEELNPMLGHRGCRLGITHPDVYRMQVRALAEAMLKVFESKKKTKLKIMIPLVSTEKELEVLLPLLKDEYFQALEGSRQAAAVKNNTEWGTMIELPRACVIADKIAPLVDFLSYGTNDLTQTTFGLSRDDSGKFLGQYQENNILSIDPFESLDQEGVGELISLSLQKARKAKPKIQIGVCGEHGGDPASIQFFQQQKFNSISCSPFRVPTARLGAARAKLSLKSSTRKKTRTRKTK